MIITTSEGLKVYYEVKGDGKPLILLHGWGGSSFGLRPLLECFSKKFRVFSLDLPGFGQSGIPPETWGSNEYASCVYQILQQLNIQQGHILAHSFGGRVAIILATRHPELVYKLVLTGSAGLPPHHAAGYYIKVGSAKLGKGLLGLFGQPGKKLQHKLAGRLGSEDYKAATPQMRAILAKVVNEDLSSFLPQIKAATLLVWGQNDSATPLAMGQQMKQMIPNSRLEVFPGSGHFAYVEKTGEFCRMVDNFLQQ